MLVTIFLGHRQSSVEDIRTSPNNRTFEDCLPQRAGFTEPTRTAVYITIN